MSRFLTAQFKLRADLHDRALLGEALGRWGHSLRQALHIAWEDRENLLHCIVEWESKTGVKRLVVDGKRLKQLIYGYSGKVQLDLHSTARIALQGQLEKILSSWLALRKDHLIDPKKNPRPAFPDLPPPTERAASIAFEAAMDRADSIITLPEEDQWRADATRGCTGTVLPFYFCSMKGGGDLNGHAGLIQREDGKLFAMPSLWPSGSPNGGPITVARNRRNRGALQNIRGGDSFRPTPKMKSSVLVPMEFCSGHRTLFLKRAAPKSCELIEKKDDYYLNVAFEYEDHPGREKTGNVMAVVRGIETLALWVVVDPSGKEILAGEADGKELKRLVGAIHETRRKRQAKGKVLAGDRRASAVAEHHIYSLGHEIRDLACQYGAEIVLMEAQRPPGKFHGKKGAGLSALLKHRHFTMLEEVLVVLDAEAGLEPAKIRKIYGSQRTCVKCGWVPGDHVRHPEAQEQQCPGCLRPRESYDRARLLALDTLRLRKGKEGRGSLQDFVRGMK